MNDISPPPRDTVDRIRDDWAAQDPALETGTIAVFGRILVAARLIEESSAEIFASIGLIRSEFDTLAQLRRRGTAMRPSELTAGIVGSAAATTKRLHRLSETGYVTRTPDPEDGRSVLITLTARGRDLVDDFLPRLLAHEEQMLAALSEEQRDELAALLRIGILAWE